MAFASVKNKMKRDKMFRQLAFLVSAATVIPDGATGPIGFGLLPQKDAKELTEAEPTLFSINPAVPPNAEGQVQIAVTPAGVMAHQSASASVAAGATASAEPAQATATFAISSDIPMPVIQRGGGQRESKYPFSKLELIAGQPFGQSFFVASTPKAFASTLSGQNRKFKKTTPVRKFTLRAVTENGISGIRVWRVTPDGKPYVAA